MVKRGLAPLLAVVVALAACENVPDRDAIGREPVPKPTTSSARVVGLVGTLSGHHSWRGQDAFEGADVAVAELNRRRLESDLPGIELVTLDDQGDPHIAAAHLTDLAASDRTIGIVYAGPPSGLAQSEDALAGAGIPGVLVSGDLHFSGRLTPHVFQASPPYLWQARRMAGYLLRDRHYETVGVLTPRGVDGRSARGSLRTAFRESGARVAKEATYRNSGDLDAALEQLRQERTEAVVVLAEPGDFETLIAEMNKRGAGYLTTSAARIASAPGAIRRERRSSDYWRPQLAAFDSSLSPRVDATLPPGTLTAESYARTGAELPIGSLVRFEQAFGDWWGEATNGWEQRAYDATAMIGWADANATDLDDRATALEGLRGERFGGLDVSFGPNNHLAVDPHSMGLWTVPAPGADPPGAGALQWVILARTFSNNGRRTAIPHRDWGSLFKRPGGLRAPRVETMRHAVTVGSSHPVH